MPPNLPPNSPLVSRLAPYQGKLYAICLIFDSNNVFKIRLYRGDVVELFRRRRGVADELVDDACNVLGLFHRRWQALTPFSGVYDAASLELTNR